MKYQSHRSGLNRRPQPFDATSTSHSLYSSEAVQGGRLSPEAVPNQPPNVQRRATLAGLYAAVKRWFHGATDAPVTERPAPRLVVIRGGAR